MSTAPKTDDPAKTAELETEAAELETDVKEAKEEAAAARKEGDDARADKLEAQITKVEGDLAEIKSTLKALAERPFHPAPEAEKTPATEPAKGDEKEGQEEEQPKERKHRFGSTKWFGDRAYED